MKSTLLAVLVLSAIAYPAFSCQVVGELGVYFDQASFEENTAYPVPGEAFHVYFVLKDCSWGGVAGFEFGWGYNPAPAVLPIITEFVLPPHAINLGTQMNIGVGLGTPLYAPGPLVLVAAGLVLTEPLDCTYIQLGPYNPASCLGQPAVSHPSDAGQIGALTFPPYEGMVVNAAGWTVPGVATIGCPGPVGTQGQSWSAIKALYE
jgi:hypothetical protein